MDYRGYRITEMEIGDPREGDNLGIMACRHRRYTLGDKEAPWETIEEAEKWLCRNAPVWYPLYLLDHGVLAMNTFGFSHIDPTHFDWVLVGWIYTTKDRIRDWFGCKRITRRIRRKVKDILLQEVDEYDKYLQGASEYVAIFEDEFIDADFDLDELKERIDKHAEETIAEEAVEEIGCLFF